MSKSGFIRKAVRTLTQSARSFSHSSKSVSIIPKPSYPPEYTEDDIAEIEAAKQARELQEKKLKEEREREKPSNSPESAQAIHANDKPLHRS